MGNSQFRCCQESMNDCHIFIDNLIVEDSKPMIGQQSMDNVQHYCDVTNMALLIREGRLDEVGKIDEIKIEPFLFGHGEFDPLIHSIVCDQLEMVKHMVEVRGMRGDKALTVALKTNNIVVAEYLKKNGFSFDNTINYVSSLEVMKLVVSWGHLPTDSVLSDIITNPSIEARNILEYVLEIRHDLKVTMDDIENMIRREFRYILPAVYRLGIHNYHRLRQLIMSSSPHIYIEVIEYLIKFGYRITKDELILMSPTDEYTIFERICKLNLTRIKDIISNAFTKVDTFEKNFNHYSTTIENFKDVAIEADLMNCCCLMGRGDFAARLVTMGVDIEEENIIVCFDIEVSSGVNKREFPLTHKLLSVCSNDLISSSLEKINQRLSNYSMDIIRIEDILDTQ